MHGAAITLVRRMLESEFIPDFLLASDMLDLSLVRSLLQAAHIAPRCAMYFHENQLVYPWSERDPDKGLQRDRHYSFMNYSSALVADKVIFNSRYHRRSFLEQLPAFLSAFPDHQNQETVDIIRKKSQVIYPGVSFDVLDAGRTESHNKVPLILWNHRWEYDKNPETFFRVLKRVHDEGMHFELAVCGRSFPTSPKIFDQAKKDLALHIVHWGFVETAEEYRKWLWRSDILPVTSHQDFFGYSAIEAMYCNTIPLLPDRLAFPEHIDDRQFFYSSDDELLQKLGKLLSPPLPKFNVQEELRMRFDWRNVIGKYHRMFEET